MAAVADDTTGSGLADAVSAFRSVIVPARLPSVPGFDVAARYRPHHPLRVGGDFFDVFTLPDGSLVVMIGDVQGKGPWAGAASVTTRWTLRSALVDHADPVQALELANRVLLERDAGDVDEGLFCSAAVVRLVARRGLVRATAAVAGHPSPRVVRPSGTVLSFAATGPLLGVFPEPSFRADRLDLGLEDRLVLFTDGVTDVPEAADGLGDLDRLLAAYQWTSSAELARHVEELPTSGGDVHRDDVAIVVASVLPVGHPGASTVLFPG